MADGRWNHGPEQLGSDEHAPPKKAVEIGWAEKPIVIASGSDGEKKPT